MQQSATRTSTVQTQQGQQSATRTSTVQTQQGPRWGALRTTSAILKILAFLVLLSCLALTALAVMGILNQATAINLISGIPFSPLQLAIGSFIGGILSFILLYAFAELIILLVAIERNTRNRN